MRSTKRLLIEERIGCDLAAFVHDLRQDGAPWTVIASRIERLTGVTITHQTLINWFGDSVSAA